MQYKFAQDFKPHHVVKPFQIPSNWKIIKSFTYGFKMPFICAWFAVSDEGKVYLINHVTGKEKSVKEIADIIKSTQDDMEISCDYNIADRAIFFIDKVTSVYREFSNNGIDFKPANSVAGSRASGWNKLHELLQNDKFFIFAGNSVFVEELLTTKTSKNNSDDIDGSRYLDVIRYALQVMGEVNPTEVKVDGITLQGALDALEASQVGYKYLCDFVASLDLNFAKLTIPQLECFMKVRLYNTGKI